MRKLSRLITLVLSVILASSAISHSSPQTIGVVQLTFYLSTSSDWTRLTFYNLTLLTWEYRLISGQHAPQLSYAITPSRMAINKRQYDGTNVTIKIEGLVQPTTNRVKLLIEKGTIGDTILRISDRGGELAIISSIGSVPGHEDINARHYELTEVFGKLNLTELTLKKFLERPMVLAFYYPWYGNVLGKSGQQFHWSDVTYRGIGSSTYYPLFGPYDSQDNGLIRAHIELARASGIEGFVCSWWGIDTFEDRSFKEILKIANSAGFNATIYYESVRDIGRDQITNELAYVLRSYSNEPSFLKIDGRPVIFLYAVSAYDRGVGFWQDVIKGVNESTNSSPIYVADTFDVAYAAAFDGFHTYNPIWIGEGAFYSAYSDQAKAARVAGRIWASTVCPGYDDRKIRSPGTYVSGEDGAYYNLTWEAAIRSDPDIVLICTWNEWHEGTNIEPSREFEFEYLQLTNYWVTILRGKAQGTTHSEPVIHQSLQFINGTLVLDVRNDGEGDAFALGVMLCSQNVSDIMPRGVIYLPVNDTCICLFIPSLGVNQTCRTRVTFQSDGRPLFSAHVLYYSLIGRKSTSTPTVASLNGESDATEHGFDTISMPLFVALIMSVMTTILLMHQRSKRKGAPINQVLMSSKPLSIDPQ